VTSEVNRNASSQGIGIMQQYRANTLFRQVKNNASTAIFECKNIIYGCRG
jgi:hypothetical protein